MARPARVHVLAAVATLLVALAGLSGGAGAQALSEKEMAAARKLHLIKCAKCHELYDPAKYGDGAWASWMAKMSRKSKLKPEQEKLLTTYLETLRKSDPPAGANARSRKP